MRGVLAGLGGAFIVAACAVTPDLVYVDDLDGSIGDAGAPDSEQNHGGDAAGDAAAGDAVADGGYSSDVGVDGFSGCALLDAIDVGCCANGNWCVGEACNHCDDCASAGCTGNKPFCCAKILSGTYKSTVCKASSTCG